MNNLSGEYNIEVVNGEFELPACFGRWFQQFPSTDLILFKVDQKDQVVGVTGTWIIADPEEEHSFRQTMHLPESVLRIPKPQSSPWKTTLPSEVVNEMAFKQQYALVLVGMYDKVEICTYGDHLLNVKSYEACLLEKQ